MVEIVGFIDQYSNTAAQTLYSFDRAYGAAQTVCVINWRGGGAATQVDSLSIGGVSGAIIGTIFDPSSRVEFWLVDTSSLIGATETFLLAFPGGPSRVNVAIHSLAAGATVNVQATRTPDVLNVTLDVAADGAVIASTSFTGNEDPLVWTGATLDYTNNVESDYYVSIAHENEIAADAAYFVSLVGNTSFNNGAMSVFSFSQSESTNVTITAIAAELSLSGETATVTATEGQVFTSIPGELSLEGSTATVQAGEAVTIQAIPAELNLTGSTAIVTAVDSQTIVSVPGVLSLEGSTAVITVNNVTNITAIAGELSLSGATPIVTLTTLALIQPPAGELSLSGATAIVTNSGDLPATLTTQIQGTVMMLGGKTTNVFAGESVYFTFSLPDEDPNRWTNVISVKNFPGDVEFISREILASGTIWIGFLTSTETAALTPGNYYLTGTLTNVQEDRVVEQSYRFKIASGWTT